MVAELLKVISFKLVLVDGVSVPVEQLLVAIRVLLVNVVYLFGLGSQKAVN